jgi:hypothetical protein
MKGALVVFIVLALVIGGALLLGLGLDLANEAAEGVKHARPA